MKERKKLFKLTTTVRLQESMEHKLPEQFPDAYVHAFDRSGELLCSARLSSEDAGSAKAVLALPAELKGQSIRLVAGPLPENLYSGVPPWLKRMIDESKDESPVDEHQPVEKENTLMRAKYTSLLRKGGYESSVRLLEEAQQYEMRLSAHDWIKWLKCCCVVRGRLIRRIELPDGSTRDLGVCHACIKIYEVDKFPKLIARLPDREIFRFRDKLLELVRNPFPEPPREFPPDYEVPPVPPIPILHETVSPAFSKPVSASSRGSEQIRINSRQMADELTPIFIETSAYALRNTLIAHATLIFPYLCAFEWLHSWFSMDLVKCTCTDEQGRFETTINYDCSGDKPDLYFKAVQCIGGTLHTLYDPGAPCHTHWNYLCGSEVLLQTHDPAARICTPGDIYIPPPGVLPWIAPWGVGGTRLDQIKQPSGYTDYGSVTDAPFGSTLGFRHGYSSAIPSAGIYYYRWLYKKDGTAQWREFADPVAATVVRHYVDEDLAHPLNPPTFPAYTLGPHAINGMHLYEFKPNNPPEPAGHNCYWPPDDWFHEIYTGILHSEKLPGGIDYAAGRYTIKLEIYDQAGVKVPHDGTRFRFIVPIGLDSDDITILTRNALPGEIDNDGFVFNLQIDNRSCSASIDAPAIGSASAGDICGFLRYDPGDTVRIGYHANHDGNHAYHAFWIRRAVRYVSYIGEADVSELVVNSSVFSDIVLHSYAGDGDGNFVRHHFPTADLLGTCSEAAFAEVLRVRAKATDGWNRLDQYDAAYERAFALARKTPPGP